MNHAVINDDLTVKDAEAAYPDFTPEEWEEIGRKLDESMEDYYKGNYLTEAEFDARMEKRRQKLRAQIAAQEGVLV